MPGNVIRRNVAKELAPKTADASSGSGEAVGARATTLL